MSANLVVDLGNTTQHETSVVDGSAGSGIVIGNVVDMLPSDTLCNFAITVGNMTSGRVEFAVQESDTLTSGSFAAITVNSGQSFWLSGGRTSINSSGLTAAAGGGLMSGVGRVSGNCFIGWFQRNKQYVRAILESGNPQTDTQTAGAFVSQLLQTGSGGGFTLSPSSGAVSV